MLREQVPGVQYHGTSTPYAPSKASLQEDADNLRDREDEVVRRFLNQSSPAVDDLPNPKPVLEEKYQQYDHTAEQILKQHGMDPRKCKYIFFDDESALGDKVFAAVNDPDGSKLKLADQTEYIMVRHKPCICHDAEPQFRVYGEAESVSPDGLLAFCKQRFTRGQAGEPSLESPRGELSIFSSHGAASQPPAKPKQIPFSCTEAITMARAANLDALAVYLNNSNDEVVLFREVKYEGENVTLLSALTNILDQGAIDHLKYLLNETNQLYLTEASRDYVSAKKC